MNKIHILLVTTFVILSARAAAQVANASCATDGEIARISALPSLNLICNDGEWVLMKQLNANGNVRVAQTDSRASPHSNSNVDDCSGECSKGGELCYASKRMRLCNGSQWISLNTTFAPTVGCPQSGVFNGAQSQVLTVAAGCSVTFKAWGGGGGGGTGGEAGDKGSFETVTIGSSERDVTYYLSVGGGGGSGNYMAAGVGGSGVTELSGKNGSWYVNAGGTGGGGAASGIWSEGLGTGKPVIIAAGGKGSASDAQICTTAKGTDAGENCGSAHGGGPQAYSSDSSILSEGESPGNLDDRSRPSGAGQGGSGVSKPDNNASAGNDGAVHWSTCEVAPCP